MKSATFLQLVVLSLAGVSLATPHDLAGSNALHRRHGSIARSRGLTRRCKPRNVTPAAVEVNAAQTTNNSGGTPANTGGGGGGGGGGTINVSADRCGPNGATSETTETSGPNGSIDWLNCGLSSGGRWDPPRITIDQLKTVNLGDALKDPASPFHTCQKHAEAIERHASANNIPAIIIASIAMQESSCNENTIGGAGGEQGLMQITPDKCGGAPGGNCLDVDFNVGTGTRYLRSQLDVHGGDFLRAMGSYNGWVVGMTEDEAKTRFGGNCRTQRNLDYLHQNVNVWFQNQNVYGAKKFGKYFNLDSC